MTKQEQILRQKRQYYHRLLLALGEERYKKLIVAERFGVESTSYLTERQLDILIYDARQRLEKVRKSNPHFPKAKSQEKSDQLVRKWRNKCLLVLNERGITATPKDWSNVNRELAKKQYQWIMPPEKQKLEIINRKGLYAFNTVDDLKKLFHQLVAIRDNERKKDKELRELMLRN